jgi:hypothetical protein
MFAWCLPGGEGYREHEEVAIQFPRDAVNPLETL